MPAMKNENKPLPTDREIYEMSKKLPTVAAAMLRRRKLVNARLNKKPSSPESERQKSRSLDKEEKPSEPIPDSSANVATKEQKGVQPTHSEKKDTTTTSDVQERKPSSRLVKEEAPAD